MQFGSFIISILRYNLNSMRCGNYSNVEVPCALGPETTPTLDPPKV